MNFECYNKTTLNLFSFMKARQSKTRKLNQRLKENSLTWIINLIPVLDE